MRVVDSDRSQGWYSCASLPGLSAFLGLVSSISLRATEGAELPTVDGWVRWPGLPGPLRFLVSRSDLDVTRPQPLASLEELYEIMESAWRTPQVLGRIDQHWHHLHPAEPEFAHFSVPLDAGLSFDVIEHIPVAPDINGHLRVGAVPFLAPFSLGSKIRAERTGNGTLTYVGVEELGERRVVRYSVERDGLAVGVSRSDFSALLSMHAHRHEWMGGGFLAVDVRKPFLVEQVQEEVSALARPLGIELREIGSNLENLDALPVVVW